MLNSDFDHLSVWEVAHRWHGVDPNLTNPKALPLEVQDTLRVLAHALSYGHISVCDDHGVEKKNPNRHPRFEEYRAKDEFISEPYTDTDEQGNTVQGYQSVPNPDYKQTRQEKRDEYVAFVDRWCEPHFRLCEGLEKCFKHRVYDKEQLERVHIDQPNLIPLCRAKRMSLPEFWFNEEELKAFDAGSDVDDIERAGLGGDESNDVAIPKVDTYTQPIIDDFWSQLNAKQKHRLMCREIASELWRMDQSLTIAGLIKHEGIQKYGGGKYYTGKNTLRDWIKNAPNRPATQSGGRPVT